MTIKREAAFHEAGHAVLAHNSKFHEVVMGIDLGRYGAGEIYISLHKPKLKAAGLPEDPSIQTNREVATELAVILCAGLAAERIAAQQDPTLTPDEECAKPDVALMQRQLSMAGMSSKFDRHQAVAMEELRRHWPVVEALAKLLFNQKTLDAYTIHQFIDAR